MSEPAGTERRFLRRLQRRDEAAFTELVERYKAMVFGVSFRLLHDRADAEDVAQDVFVRVFKGLDGFREQSSLRTWIYQITLNLSRNRLRARSRRAHGAHDSLDEHSSLLDRSLFGDSAAPRPESLGEDPTRATERREAASLLSDGLARLQSEAREVLVLRDLEELSYDEIAVVLGVAVGTVKSRLFRARAALRQSMEGLLDD